ncbi:MAG: S1-like domain-containing RNA-binding protein [Victivallaceae bacterium]|nr:S1-like domain-containing RNA-binding protein [Victivallaceae bacterium]
MIINGAYQELRVEKETVQGVYVGDSEGNRVLLPSRFVTPEMVLGKKIRVFVYNDSEDRPVATTQIPLAVAGEICVLRVKDVNPVGAFLDWGLDKDLMIPYKEQLRPLEVGEDVLVKVKSDLVSGRIIATMKVRKGTVEVPRNLPHGHQFEGSVIEVTHIGWRLLMDDKYLGMLYRSDVYERLELGDKRTVYLTRTRSDGRADVTLQKPGYKEAIPEATDTLLEVLQAQGGTLKVTAKTPPAEIERVFKMSKKTFKKVLGALYKARRIEITENNITLIEKNENMD